MYLEWLCTWWAVAPVSREQRRSLLPLLCLELSSIDEEDGRYDVLLAVPDQTLLES